MTKNFLEHSFVTLWHKFFQVDHDFFRSETPFYWGVSTQLV
jgi:hypothetical protein